MHMFHITNACIPVLRGALWDMEQVHSEICEIGVFSCVRGTSL